jgi:hypothetical protein
MDMEVGKSGKSKREIPKRRGKKQGQMRETQQLLSPGKFLSQAQGKTEPRDKQEFEKSQLIFTVWNKILIKLSRLARR